MRRFHTPILPKSRHRVLEARAPQSSRRSPMILLHLAHWFLRLPLPIYLFFAAPTLRCLLPYSGPSRPFCGLLRPNKSTCAVDSSQLRAVCLTAFIPALSGFCCPRIDVPGFDECLTNSPEPCAGRCSNSPQSSSSSSPENDITVPCRLRAAETRGPSNLELVQSMPPLSRLIVILLPASSRTRSATRTCCGFGMRSPVEETSFRVHWPAVARRPPPLSRSTPSH